MTDEIREKSDWRKAAFSVSVILNLFFVALICGHVWRHHGADFRHGSQFALTLANAEATLPPRDAAAFGGVLRHNAQHYSASAQKVIEARRELIRQIGANTFDREKVWQALRAWRAARNRFLDDFGDTFVEALAQVSPEGRRKLVAQRQPQSDKTPAL